MSNRYLNIIERLYQKILKTDNCWLWTGCKNVDGYGILRLNNKTLLSHRVSYDYHKGAIPKGLFVCHKCDNPSCVNPSHLFLGSSKDNKQDSIRKNRAVFANNKKLTDKEVQEIRAARRVGVGAAILANQYNITKWTIYDVCSRSWSHIN
jgi:HNH endonuclease